MESSIALPCIDGIKVTSESSIDSVDNVAQHIMLCQGCDQAGCNEAKESIVHFILHSKSLEDTSDCPLCINGSSIAQAISGIEKGALIVEAHGGNTPKASRSASPTAPETPQRDNSASKRTRGTDFDPEPLGEGPDLAPSRRPRTKKPRRSKKCFHAHAFMPCFNDSPNDWEFSLLTLDILDTHYGAAEALPNPEAYFQT